MLEVLYGNLLESDCDAIVHQVNCQGVMGSGIAKQIRDKWPVVFNDYIDEYKKGHLKLGHVITSGEDPVIFSICAQNRYGRTGQFTNYQAFATCIRYIVNLARIQGLKKIGLPFGIGAGLGGGDWVTLYSILGGIADESMITLYLYKFGG